MEAGRLASRSLASQGSFPSFPSKFTTVQGWALPAVTETQASSIKQDPARRGGLNQAREAEALSHSEECISQGSGGGKPL